MPYSGSNIIFLILLVGVLNFNKSSGQSFEQIPIKSHWKHCNSNVGYEEVHFYDSFCLVCYSSNPSGRYLPVTIVNQELIIGVESPLKYKINFINSDTLKLILTDNSDINSTIVLTKMKDSLYTIFDYKCSLKINYRDYKNSITNDFRVREKESGCKITNHSQVKTLVSDTDFIQPPNQDWVGLYGFSFKKYEGNEYSSFPVFLESKIINDTMFATIIINDHCYLNYLGDVREDGNCLNFFIRKEGANCDEVCPIELHYKVLLNRKRFSCYQFMGNLISN